MTANIHIFAVWEPRLFKRFLRDGTAPSSNLIASGSSIAVRARSVSKT
jgi:hypothetical protein